MERILMTVVSIEHKTIPTGSKGFKWCVLSIFAYLEYLDVEERPVTARHAQSMCRQ